MAGNRKRLFGKVPRWRIALRLAGIHAFRDDYFESPWSDWEQRIKEGHQKEMDWIEKQSQNWTGTDYEFGEIFGEDYVRSRDLTNNMYAALVVSIWSEMENFLKTLIRMSYSVLGEQKTPPARIDQIKNDFENKLGVKLEKCKSYSTVDAIRLLNNLFKHDSGYCDPESEEYKKIKKSSTAKQAIPDKRKHDTRWRAGKIEVKYSALPLQDIILACNGFCTDLLGKVEIKLKNRLEEAEI